MSQLITLLLIAAGTYALRALSPRLIARRNGHDRIQRYLRGVPAATAGALLIPAAFMAQPGPQWLVLAALVAAGLGAWFSRQLWVAVLLCAAVDFLGLTLLH